MISNPPQNKLPNGLPEARLVDVIRRSGYPLQSVVAAQLKELFVVTEEWGYSDRTANETRTLDVFAWKTLEAAQEDGVAVNPAMALLVECKHSDLPFVFFSSVASTGRVIPDFPVIAGVQHPTLFAGSSNRQVAPANCLRLDTEPFVSNDPPVCTSFGRARGKGTEGSAVRASREKEQSKGSSGEDEQHRWRGLEISGAEAYQNTVLPLVSALEYTKSYYRKVGGNRSIQAILVLAVCVIDGPMAVSEGTPDEPTLSMNPWVRVVRREATPTVGGYNANEHVIDFVHRFVLKDYLVKVLEFSSVFRGRVIEKAFILAEGKGEVNNLSSWELNHVRPRPTP